MQKELFKRFETYFGNLNKEVRDEEMLLFLDKNYKKQFDRKIFNEIRNEVVVKKEQEMNPSNFATTFFEAYENLKLLEKQSKTELNSLTKLRNHISSNRSQANFKYSEVPVERSSVNNNGQNLSAIDNSIQMSEFSDQLLLDYDNPDQMINACSIFELYPLNFEELPDDFNLEYSIQFYFSTC